MTEPSPERLSEEDIKFLMNLLAEAEEEANTEFRIDGNNKAEAQLAIERISRIRRVITKLEEQSKK
jgi:hypothetical protein